MIFARPVASPLPKLFSNLATHVLRKLRTLYTFCIKEITYFRKGFVLIGYGGQYTFFFENEEGQVLWESNLRKVCVLRHIYKEFVFGKMLGKGNFAKVLIRNTIAIGSSHTEKER